MGVPFPETGPHRYPFAGLGQDRLRDILESAVDFEAMPGLATAAVPELVVGTVDVGAGTFETFTNADLTAEAVLSSAAVPQPFPAVEIDGDPGDASKLDRSPRLV